MEEKEQIILGSGNVHIETFSGTVPDPTEFCKETNRMAYISGGATLEYKPSYYCPTAIKWLRKTLHNVYSFTKLDTDYKEWSDYLSKCVMVFQKNRGLTQDACVGLLTTYRLLKG